MRLENLYQNFGRSSPEEQLKFIVEYRLKRAQDLERIPVAKKSSSAKKSKCDLSEDEKVMMKLLGLKKKDIESLRALSPQSVDAELPASDDVDLFKDDTYEIGEDS